MSDRLGHKQTAVMFALMAVGREVTNPELKQLVGFTVDLKERTGLKDLHLITSRKVGRALAHELTDQGWAWCGDELAKRTAPPPRPRSSIVPALYLLMGALAEYLKREGLSPAVVFAPRVEMTAEEIAERIQDTYHKLARTPRGWVGLADLRPMLGDAPRDEVDAVLKELSRSGRAHLVPESNRKTLTPADHEAAIHLGGEDNHLISIEVS